MTSRSFLESVVVFFFLLLGANPVVVEGWHNPAPSCTARQRHLAPPQRTVISKLEATTASSSSNDATTTIDPNRPTPLSPNRCPPPKEIMNNVQILSLDPLVYRVPNLLSPMECQTWIDRCQDLEQQDERPMTQSNAPEISLNVQKLWPLPLLSLGAGIPPLIRAYDLPSSSSSSSSLTSPPSLNDLVALCIPPILLAFLASLVLSFGIILPLIRQVASSSSSSSTLRTSVAMAWNEEDDIPFVQTLVDKVCAITNHPWQCWEAPVLTRYSCGARFARHSDASPTRGSEWKEKGGQRVVTCICYLNTVEQQQQLNSMEEERVATTKTTGTGSGCTYFDQLGLEVAPVQGSALFFYPTQAKDPLQADDRTTHESLPVVGTNQEKYIVQLFGRVGPRVPPPLGLPDLYRPLSLY